MPKVNSLFISKPDKGRRFAISDVHGCYKTFKALLKVIKLKKRDQLFLIGDMINRGPSSDKVLDYIIKLQNKGFQLYYLRGNHEQAILNAGKKSTGQRKRVFKTYKSIRLITKGELRDDYKRLLFSTLHFVELEDYFLVHAGFNHKAKDPFQHTHSMLNSREFKADKDYLKEKTIVFGHTPTDISKILERVKESRKKICIDNGCANPKSKEQGALVCFNLDHKTLLVQPNLDI